MNLTIIRITARALLGRRRLLLLLPLPFLMVGLAVLADNLGARPDEWVEAVVVGLGMGVVLPVMALIVGTGVLRSEIDDGTLPHILAKPLSRWEIIGSKLAVAVVTTAVATAAPFYVVGVLASSSRLGLGLAVGAVLGSVAYCAVFVALSLLTSRPVLVGLAYVLVWEGLLGNLVAGTRLLSVQQYVVTVSAEVSASDLLSPTVSVVTALTLAAALVTAMTWLAVDRLRSFSVVGETG
jgi:ABC-2 type transport system permease protein